MCLTITAQTFRPKWNSHVQRIVWHKFCSQTGDATCCCSKDINWLCKNEGCSFYSPVMYHFSLGDCIFHSALHFTCPSNNHKGGPLKLQVLILRLAGFSYGKVCVACSRNVIAEHYMYIPVLTGYNLPKNAQQAALQ
jgi:hypothetical protein